MRGAWRPAAIAMPPMTPIPRPDRSGRRGSGRGCGRAGRVGAGSPQRRASPWLLPPAALGRHQGRCPPLQVPSFKPLRSASRQPPSLAPGSRGRCGRRMWIADQTPPRVQCQCHRQHGPAGPLGQGSACGAFFAPQHAADRRSGPPPAAMKRTQVRHSPLALQPPSGPPACSRSCGPLD